MSDDPQVKIEVTIGGQALVINLYTKAAVIITAAAAVGTAFLYLAVRTV